MTEKNVFEFGQDDAGRPTWIKWGQLNIQFLPGSGSIGEHPHPVFENRSDTKIEGIEQVSLRIGSYKFWSMSATLTSKALILHGSAYMKRKLLTYTRKQIVISYSASHFDVRVDAPRVQNPDEGRWLKGIPLPEGDVYMLDGAPLYCNLQRS